MPCSPGATHTEHQADQADDERYREDDLDAARLHFFVAFCAAFFLTRTAHFL